MQFSSSSMEAELMVDGSLRQHPCARRQGVKCVLLEGTSAGTVAAAASLRMPLV